jgi:hypothetical protein
MTERAQGGHRAQLARLQVEPGPRQHFAEGEVDGKPDKVGGNVGRREDGRGGLGASKPLEGSEAYGMSI